MSSSETQPAKKRTPRKRVARKVAGKKSAASTVSARTNSKKFYTYGGVVVAGFVLSLIMVFIAKGDAGVIDVSQAIRDSNAAVKAAGGNDSELVNVPDDRPRKKNGGLIGKGKSAEPEPVVASSTGTSTASTTDDVAGEIGEEEGGDVSEEEVDVEAENAAPENSEESLDQAGKGSSEELAEGEGSNEDSLEELPETGETESENVE